MRHMNKYILATLSFVATWFVAACDQPVAEDDFQGSVNVAAGPTGVAIINLTNRTTYYMAYEEGTSYVVDWIPCDYPDACPDAAISPDDSILVLYQDIMGWEPGRKVAVFWWILVADDQASSGYVVQNFTTVSVDPYDPDPENLLEQAWEQQAVGYLDTFFSQWHAALPAISPAELEELSTEKQAVYDVFGDFYNPFDFDLIGDSDLGDSFYFDVQYVIVQNEVMYGIYTQDISDSAWISDMLVADEYFNIFDFRPQLDFGDKPVVYLSPLLEEALTNYLTLGRLKFLNQVIGIFPGHWVGWHIVSHPVARSILLDSGLRRARIYYQAGWMGFMAVLMKLPNGTWSIVHVQLIWIT